jgi:hypothetical protein
MNEEFYSITEAEESKNLAKEDALSLIAEFVKDVKKKFNKREDQLEILRAADKTLTFYIDEIASDSVETSTGMGDFEPVGETPADDIDLDIDTEEV